MSDKAVPVESNGIFGLIGDVELKPAVHTHTVMA